MVGLPSYEKNLTIRSSRFNTIQHEYD